MSRGGIWSLRPPICALGAIAVAAVAGIAPTATMVSILRVECPKDSKRSLATDERLLSAAEAEEMLAVVSQFGKALTDIVKGPVGALFAAEFAGWSPTGRQLLDGADVDNTIMQIALQSRHMACQETPVLPNTIAT